MPLDYDEINELGQQYYGDRTKPVPKPEVEFGIDTSNQIIYDINTVKSERIDTATINSFTQVSQRRDELYNLIDSMCEDTRLSAALEIYVEDVTEKAPSGKIVWAESNNSDIQTYINFLLDSLNVDKNIFKWAYCLCKYGDMYLRLFKEKDTIDPIFDNRNRKANINDDHKLNEAIKVVTSQPQDKYAFYVEMVPNPAQVFELTKFGKSAGYIEVPRNAFTNGLLGPDETSFGIYSNYSWRYRFNKSDIKIYSGMDFVHASLEDDITRSPEEVSIILDDLDWDKEPAYDPRTGKLVQAETSGSVTSSGANGLAYSYSVRRGQSVLYDVFKTYRQLSLLENSILLNRLTKSSVTRVVGVEVGDMPKEKVQDTLQRLKTLVEQKSALAAGQGLSEYTAGGAYENNIYVPIYNGKGNISTTNIGGDTDTNVNGLDDIDYFTTKLYSGLKIPKQYLGDTDDAAGFNGGTSLAIVSSRYAKTVMRIQAVLLQCITDLINILLFDRGFNDYINKYELHITAPTTQEQLDRQEQKSGQVALIRDVMDLVSDIEDPAQKLRILQALLKELNLDSEISAIIQEEIDKLDTTETPEDDEDSFDNEPLDFGEDESDTVNNCNMEFSSPSSDVGSAPPELADLGSEEAPTSSETELPNMADLGVDFTDNTGI